MAASISSIITEALKLSGIRYPSNSQKTRATDEWYPEVLDDIRSRKHWKVSVNELKDWRFALTKGVLLKALRDKFDGRRSSERVIKRASDNYEDAIKILIRKDTRETMKRQFPKKSGGMPLTR